MQGHVEPADRHAHALELLDEGGEACGKRDAASLDADEHEVVDATVALDDLVREALHGAADAGGVEDRTGGGADGVARGRVLHHGWPAVVERLVRCHG